LPEVTVVTALPPEETVSVVVVAAEVAQANGMDALKKTNKTRQEKVGRYKWRFKYRLLLNTTKQWLLCIE
jgi:hypothetical protein